MFKVETSLRESGHAGVNCAYGVVSLPGTKMSVYSFYVDGLLIDTGSPFLLNDYIPFFTKKPIDWVVLTHYHEDHAGGLNGFKIIYMFPSTYMNPHLRRAASPLITPNIASLPGERRNPLRLNRSHPYFLLKGSHGKRFIHPVIRRIMSPFTIMTVRYCSAVIYMS